MREGYNSLDVACEIKLNDFTTFHPLISLPK